MYFELEFLNGDLYKGELSDNSPSGLCLYHLKKSKTVLIGTISANGFNGPSVVYDLSE